MSRQYDTVASALLGEGIAQWSAGIALLYSPREALLLRVGHGQLHCRTGPVDGARLEAAFDLTAFTPDLQVRLWRSGGQVLAGASTCPSESAGCLVGQHLIRGRLATTDRGWGRMSDPQTGGFDVPLPPGARPGDDLALQVHECLAQDEQGNTTVARTRFTGIVRAGAAA